MADGTRVYEPPASPTTATVDSHEVDYGGGDIRDRQRVMLGGDQANQDVATAVGVPSQTDRGLVIRPASAPPNYSVAGVLSGAAGSGAPQVLASYSPNAAVPGATALMITVPDGHESSQIYLSGTFSAGSQVFFEGSADGTDGSWFALNHRRNSDANTNEETTLLDANPVGGPSPVGAGLSNWRGSPGGVRYFRVRCGTLQAGDSINVRISTARAGGPVFQQGPPPLPTDAYSTGTLGAVGDTVVVRTVGTGAWAAFLTGNFTGTVYFEASVDGVNWKPINGAVQGVGALQTSLTGTGAAGQTLQVRGSSGGLSRVRLRAGADFVGTFTGILRAGAGTAGVFMVAPVPVAGLTLAQTTRVSVGTAAVRLDTNPLAARTSVEVQYLASSAANNGRVVVGFGAGLTLAQGRELQPGESWTLDLTSSVQVWAVAANNNQAVQLTEVG